MNDSNKTFLILGGSGQDGRILTSKLIYDGFNVIQLNRQFKNYDEILSYKSLNTKKNKHNLKIIKYDYLNNSVENFIKIINKYQPQFIVNFASVSSILESTKDPYNCVRSGFLNHNIILESLRLLKSDISYVYAGSIEMFHPNNKDCNLSSNIEPSNPYGLTKALSYLTTKQYREIYSLNVMTAVFSNHESFLRSSRFVTGKIFRTAIRAINGESVNLELGSRRVKRDWGLANEYMDVIFEMLNNEPRDRIIATGTNITLEKFVDLVFDNLNLDSKKYIKLNDKLSRPDDLFYREINQNELSDKIYMNITKSPEEVIEKLTNEWINYG